MKKQMKLLAGAVALLAGALAALPAQAGDNNGNFQVKIGVSGVLTDDHTSSLTANGANILPGNHADTDDMVLPTRTLITTSRSSCSAASARRVWWARAAFRTRSLPTRGCSRPSSLRSTISMASGRSALTLEGV